MKNRRAVKTWVEFVSSARGMVSLVAAGVVSGRQASEALWGAVMTMPSSADSALFLNGNPIVEARRIGPDLYHVEVGDDQWVKQHAAELRSVAKTFTTTKKAPKKPKKKSVSSRRRRR